MVTKWITHTGSDVSIILIIMILFTGIAGATIRFTDTVILPGTILSTTHLGDGEELACTRLIADGDGDILLITVITVLFTVDITDGVILTVITDMADITADTMVDITIMDGMRIQEIMTMEDVDLPAQT